MELPNYVRVIIDGRKYGVSFSDGEVSGVAWWPADDSSPVMAWLPDELYSRVVTLAEIARSAGFEGWVAYGRIYKSDPTGPEASASAAPGVAAELARRGKRRPT